MQFSRCNLLNLHGGLTKPACSTCVCRDSPLSLSHPHTHPHTHARARTYARTNARARTHTRTQHDNLWLCIYLKKKCCLRPLLCGLGLIVPVGRCLPACRPLRELPQTATTKRTVCRGVPAACRQRASGSASMTQTWRGYCL